MKVITIGKRLISTEQLAFVEPFDVGANPEFKPEKDFKARVVLLNRDVVLTEQTPSAFAEEHGLHLFAEDDVAVNRPSSTGSKPSNRPTASNHRSLIVHGSNGAMGAGPNRASCWLPRRKQ